MQWQRRQAVAMAVTIALAELRAAAQIAPYPLPPLPLMAPPRSQQPAAAAAAVAAAAGGGGIRAQAAVFGPNWAPPVPQVTGSQQPPSQLRRQVANGTGRLMEAPLPPTGCSSSAAAGVSGFSTAGIGTSQSTLSPAMLAALRQQQQRPQSLVPQRRGGTVVASVSVGTGGATAIAMDPQAQRQWAGSLDWMGSAAAGGGSSAVAAASDSGRRSGREDDGDGTIARPSVATTSGAQMMPPPPVPAAAAQQLPTIISSNDEESEMMEE